MHMTFRWFGPADPIPLAHIRHVSGVVSALYDVPVGAVWSRERLERLKAEIDAVGLTFAVVESIPVHEDIKLGRPSRDRLIATYCESVRAMGALRIPVLCYNFMPVFDWVRTNLAHLLADFLERVVPAAEDAGVRMAIHPDDPPWSIFGLPRIVCTGADLERLVALVDRPTNGVTFCTGSLGADPDNDLPALVRRLGAGGGGGRVHFAHCRNVRVTGERRFHETAHPSACGGVDLCEVLRALRDVGFTGPMRPDHGRMIWGERGRPGYGLYDRALGAMYLQGLWEGLTRSGG